MVAQPVKVRLLIMEITGEVVNTDRLKCRLDLLSTKAVVRPLVLLCSASVFANKPNRF